MNKRKYTKKNILNKIVHRRERSIFFACLSLFILGAGVYMFSVGSIVFAVVERKYAEKHIVSLKSDISNLESRYFENTKTITEEYAREHGFVKPTSIVFQDRTSKVAKAVTLEHGF